MKNQRKIWLLIIASFLVISCKKEFFEPEISNDPESIFEAFYTDFDVNFVNMENRNVNWDSLYVVYRPQVTTQTTDEELYQIMTSMLAELNDGHVSLVAPGKDVWNANIYYRKRIEDDLFSLDLIKSSYLGSNLNTSFNELNTFGIIGNIGYCHFKYDSENILEFNDILEGFSNTDGLIIDLRHNGGGNFTTGMTEFGRLVEEEQLCFRVKSKSGVGENDFTPWYYWSVFPEGEFYDKPVVVLTDRYTISAGERMAMVFKALPNCTIVGDTTNGAISTKIGRELPNGFFYTITHQLVEYQDGRNFEGPGVPPDIYFKNSTAGMNSGVDETLEYALSLF